MIICDKSILSLRFLLWSLICLRQSSSLPGSKQLSRKPNAMKGNTKFIPRMSYVRSGRIKGKRRTLLLCVQIPCWTLASIVRERIRNHGFRTQKREGTGRQHGKQASYGAVDSPCRTCKDNAPLSHISTILRGTIHNGEKRATAIAGVCKPFIIIHDRKLFITKSTKVDCWPTEQRN